MWLEWLDRVLNGASTAADREDDEPPDSGAAS
jgi:hypothetical protein